MVLVGKESFRESSSRTLNADLVVAGGGLSGTCAAITAAREGLEVILVQDRPVLGGNASSEVRLWALGATSHMGNNNRWAREGGVIDEIMSENLWRNPEGNPVLFDTILLDKVWAESKLTLLLDTVIYQVLMDNERIDAVRAYCSQESVSYLLEAPLFCDATGDGTVAYAAGASFRVGAEKADEFNELLAPDRNYGELLGSTIYFYSRDTGNPVQFTAPDFALEDITEIPRYKRIKASEHGCSYWWLEYGGRLDTIGNSGEIKRELLRVVYGVWNHIKNSGRFPDAENLTLEWVGTIPGKRESRRFEGDYMLVQSDIVEQHTHPDAVSFGGWAIDLHPADGVYSEKPPCNQYHSRGVYQIPYRSLYSRDVPNLFLTGRLISASHVALGSARVMMTGAHNGQAVAVAAALCREKNSDPKTFSSGPELSLLQRRLIRSGQFIPHLMVDDPEDLASEAEINVSDTLILDELPGTGTFHEVVSAEGMLLPFSSGEIPVFGIRLKSDRTLTAVFQLRRSDYYGNYSPDTVIEEVSYDVESGFSGVIALEFTTILEVPEYLSLVLQPSEGLQIAECRKTIPGILRLTHGANEKVAVSEVQEPPPGTGVDRLEFWLPTRRPEDSLWSFTVKPPLQPYSADFIRSGYERPFISANCWAVGASDCRDPEIVLKWENIRIIRRCIIALDGDFDHPMESVQYSHPERVSPFLPERIEILDSSGSVLTSVSDVHGSRLDTRFAESVNTSSLRIRFIGFRGDAIAVYRVRIFS